MEGLSNKGQALALAIASGCMALGTAGASIPNFVPEDIKVPFATIFWLLGIIGFALKEALGSKPSS